LIRQAISCDICATEKKQTNHWFVAIEQGGELRLSGWSSRCKLRPGSKHLCGQTCLHKLVDEFMARNIAVRAPVGVAGEVAAQQLVLVTDASLTSDAAFTSEADLEEPIPATVESSARLIGQPQPAVPKRLPFRAPAELVAMPGRQQADATPVPDEAPRFTSRNWRAEAWDRERERELRAVERRPGIASRRRSGS
jgi:hypothetical protein